MAGEARTQAFVVGAATVMVGPPASLWDLTPDNSLGFVKNFVFETNPAYITLTQDKNRAVASVLTNLDINIGMEVYELTSKNLGYSIGTAPIEIEEVGQPYDLAAPLEDGSYSLFFVAPESVVNSFPVGGWIAIQDMGELDRTHVAEITSHGISQSGDIVMHQIDFQQGCAAFSLNSRVMAVNVIDFGTEKQVPNFGVKVTGFLSDGRTPLSIVMPKVRLRDGFDLKFSEDFSFLPLRFQPMSLLPTDTLYTDFSDGSCARVFSAWGNNPVEELYYTPPPKPVARYLRLRNGQRMRVRSGGLVKVRHL
jgi:hypothetical protein